MRIADLKQQIHGHFTAIGCDTCTTVPIQEAEHDEHLTAWRNTTDEQERRIAMEIYDYEYMTGTLENHGSWRFVWYFDI